MDSTPTPLVAHNITSSTSPFNLSNQLSDFYAKSGHLAIYSLFSASTAPAATYLKSDPTNIYNASRRTRLVLSALYFVAKLCYQYEKHLDGIVDLWSTGQGSWTWGLAWAWSETALKPVAAVVYSLWVGVAVPDLLGAVLLWRNRGGTITPETRMTVASILLFFLCAAVAFHVGSVAAIELIFTPVELLLGERITVAEVRGKMVEAVLASVSMAVAWVLFKQDGVVEFVEPIWGTWRSIWSPSPSDEKDVMGKDKVTQDIKHDGGPEVRLA
ncbi:hypothetical protein K461DRAFT_276705 [Myriangium duriaei CBS 260.36]|uniref:Uncharacterized protein n=1 Tax=Myriangium duriaei CBS 260.36 TaxID=1168546 RepID=A0A9P4J762_9PEZI|nr:hypothetical protein K461DRAFT_276705 [Myriangium duriaei CBS 260.36]